MVSSSSLRHSSWARYWWLYVLVGYSLQNSSFVNEMRNSRTRLARARTQWNSLDKRSWQNEAQSVFGLWVLFYSLCLEEVRPSPRLSKSTSSWPLYYSTIRAYEAHLLVMILSEISFIHLDWRHYPDVWIPLHFTCYSCATCCLVRL